MDSDRIAEMRVLRASGETLQSIADTFGVSRQRVHQILDTKNFPLRAFQTQRNMAKRRGIEFKFTFAQWWKFWQDSGKWERRGLRGCGFVMCRFGDVGPYSQDNCYITTTGNNFRHAMERKHGRLSKFSAPRQTETNTLYTEHNLFKT